MSSRMIAFHSVIRQASKGYFRSLWVEFPAIIHVRQGCKHIQSETDEVYVKSDHIVAISPGQVLHVTNQPDTEEDYIADVFVFDTALVRECYEKLNPVPSAGSLPSLHVTGEMLSVFRNAGQDFSNSELPESIITHRATELLLWLGEANIYFRIPNEITLHDRVRKLVTTDLSRNWKAQEVAQSLAMSEQNLRRRLSGHGTSFMEILTEARLGRALDLLQMTNLPITTIAFHVGYGTPSGFTERFKNRFNIPPTAIRKRVS